MLRNLIEVTIDLSLTPSFDELCRKAVELGCSKLGFDRLGLWFIDLDDPQYIIGSFGVDENGQIRDERNIRLIHSVHEVNKKLISDRTYIYYAENTPVYDEKAQVVGNADKAAVSLWDGNTIIGFLNTDNFVNHQTIDERQRELLMLYAQAIGHQGTIKRAQQKLELLAITDPLTDLLNRRSFFIEAEKLFARSKHPPYRLTIMMFDIDHFKIVNDKYGHQAGDAVLREIAARIRNNLRPTDLLGRYGGEEFIALLPRTSFSTIAKIADRLIRAVREPPIKSNGGEITVTTSIGIALLSDNVASLDDLLYLADQALYEAKQTGRNRWVVRLVEEKRENP